MTTTHTDGPTTTEAISPELVASYRERGFVKIPQVLGADEVARFRTAVAGYSATGEADSADPVFRQFVDAWRHDADISELTLHHRLGAIATKLAGVDLRLWHDQVLVKPPHNGARTEFHQDRPYWPHESRHALSAWIALVDVPVERGCMSFIPGSHRRRDLSRQDLNDAGSLMGMWPEIEWSERVTIPLRAGDCTFHNAFTAHTANANLTDEPRIAHVVIYTDHDTVYTGEPHVVTDGRGLTTGVTLPDELFPRFGAS